MRPWCVACLRVAATAVLAWAVAASPASHAQGRHGRVHGRGYPVFVPAYPLYLDPYLPPPPPATPEQGAWPYITDPDLALFGTSTTRCLAGAYICPAEQPGTVGSSCSCRTPTTQVPGHIG